MKTVTSSTTNTPIPPSNPKCPPEIIEFPDNSNCKTVGPILIPDTKIP